MDMLHVLSSSMSISDFEELCIKIWEIWKDRCNLQHKDQSLRYKGANTNIVDQTDHYVTAYREAQIKHPYKTIPLSTKYSHSPSPETTNYFAIYVDAAYRGMDNAFSMAFVIYDPGCRQIAPPGSIMAA